MKIHGVRIYPQSVSVVPGKGAPIFVHGSVDDRCSDFFYIFRPIAALWHGHLIADDFSVTVGGNPIPNLRKAYGAAFFDADLKSQLLLLRGDEFLTWGKSRYCCEGAFLPIFREAPGFKLLERLYWDRNFQLSSNTWPPGMKALLHMWDDIYWQFFSAERSDIDLLVRAHAGDPKLKMYFVDFDREFPDPSNQELQPAEMPEGT